jgi:alcohol dehydrogenase, propanol-preferring
VDAAPVFRKSAKSLFPLTMKAMVFHRVGEPLSMEKLPVPEPAAGEVLVKVEACGVCRTDLHVVDGELDKPKLPLVPGHEIVGQVVRGSKFQTGQRVGIPWLGFTCGVCKYCRRDQENLCERAEFTGYTRDGGYAEFVKADERFTFPIPEEYDDPAIAAPLLCAGLIGYRSLRLSGSPDQVKRLGLYGFGAAAHLVAQAAQHRRQEVYAFSRPGRTANQEFAKRLGAVWTGGSDQQPPEPLDAAIIFAPAGALVPQALQAVDKGGVVVCGGIHMSDIPAFGYNLLWEERILRSVANLTRRDAEEFLRLAPEAKIRPEIERVPLSNANEALRRLRQGDVSGALVLIP